MKPETHKPDLAALRIDDDARGASGRKPYVLWAVVAVVVVAGGLGWTLLGGSAVPEVRVTRVNAPVSERGPVSLTASGYVTARRQATVSAEVTARVESVRVDEGSVVDQGQVLATLDVIDARRQLDVLRSSRSRAAATLKERQVALDNSRRQLERTQALADRKFTTQAALDDAKTEVDRLVAQIAVAEAELREIDARSRVAQTQIDKGTVRAPFAGVVVSKDANEGEMVSPMSAGGSFTRTGIATLVDMSSLELEVDVNESYIARVTPGMPVEATLSLTVV